VNPTASPTLVPSRNPTTGPTVLPTKVPTKLSTSVPTLIPSVNPTASPTLVPSRNPTTGPTVLPTKVPTKLSTSLPTLIPRVNPTASPTLVPSRNPTLTSSKRTTSKPSLPTLRSSDLPSLFPSVKPSSRPSATGSNIPSPIATYVPTSNALCSSSRCGPHGSCSVSYASGAPQVTCICEANWSGPTCDQNPCLSVNCSGNGVCQTVGDVGYQCTCNAGYTGMSCEKTCNGMCPSHGSFNSYGCAWWDMNPIATHYCNAGGGCSYPSLGTTLSSDWCCYKNCPYDSCKRITCPTAPNDCHFAGVCSSGVCSPPTRRADGSPCNSVLNGVCMTGICTLLT